MFIKKDTRKIDEILINLVAIDSSSENKENSDKVFMNGIWSSFKVHPLIPYIYYKAHLHLKLSNRAFELQGTLNLLAKPIYRPAFNHLRSLNLYNNSLTSLSVRPNIS